MIPRITTLTEKKLIGKRLKMNFANNKTFELWNSFIPRRSEIKNGIGTEMYSMQIYAPLFFENFNPNAEFEKWSAVEVLDFTTIPERMETFVLLGGLYAVFDYKGDGTNAQATFQYIFGTWIPNSEYVLDDRPHFEILGEKYKRNDPDSEEEIWIPLRKK